MKPYYSIKKKVKRRYYSTSWKEYVKGIRSEEIAVKIITTELNRIRNMRMQNKKGKRGHKYIFVYGLFLDNSLIKEYKA